MTTSPDKTRGDCARFRVPEAGCSNFSYFKEYVEGRPLMDAKTAACSDLYSRTKAKEARIKKIFERCLEALKWLT